MIVALNHKSQLLSSQMLTYLQEYQKLQTYNHQLLLFPSTCYLGLCQNIENLGSQDLSCYPKGAYTGEISGEALKSLGVSYVLINHSERHLYQQETLSLASQKLQRALATSLIPIICIGETLQEHQAGTYLEVLQQKLDQLISSKVKGSFIIAYEPLYAIGSGIIPEASDISEVVSMLKRKYNCPVLYGGSLNVKNIDIITKIPLLDGILLGGVSLNLTTLQQLLAKLPS